MSFRSFPKSTVRESPSSLVRQRVLGLSVLTGLEQAAIVNAYREKDLAPPPTNIDTHVDDARATAGGRTRHSTAQSTNVPNSQLNSVLSHPAAHSPNHHSRNGSSPLHPRALLL